jgi:NADH dehydrogenase
MDFQKSLIIGVEFKELRASPSSQHIFAEVVLIDKTQKSLQPILYRLKKEPGSSHNDLMDVKRHLTSIQRDAFMLVGDVLSIDKKKKMIYLANNNTVSYNYLIVASGPKHSFEGSNHEEEFAVGLQTLADALKIQKELPLFVLGPKPKEGTLAIKERLSKKNTVGQVVIPQLPNIGTLEPLSYYLPHIEKRYYEVQL